MTVVTKDRYKDHIIMKHKSKPAYPGPADIEKYELQLVVNGNGNKNKVTDMALANLSGNGVMENRDKDVSI